MPHHLANSIATIRASLDVLCELGSVYELRALGVAGRKRIDLGYFDNLDAMAQAAAKLDGNAIGVYLTLNPVNSALLSRAANRIIEWAPEGTGTVDKYIERRRWLPIDTDPDRPSGISSSEAEHQAAMERATIIRQELRDRGWPNPVVADSANGGHLLYPVDLPNDDASRDLIQRCQMALAARYTGKKVNIDAGVFNAARIWKLYGTLAKKGDSTSERPHRRAAITSVPEQRTTVSLDLLEALAAESPPMAPAKGKQKTAPHTSTTTSMDQPAEGAAVDDRQAVDEIKRRLDMVEYARLHYGGEAVQEGREWRILGNGGLLIKPEEGVWYRHGDEHGGDAIELLGYTAVGAHFDRDNADHFRQALEEGVRETGVDIPDAGAGWSGVELFAAGGSATMGDPEVAQATVVPNAPPRASAWGRSSVSEELARMAGYEEDDFLKTYDVSELSQLPKPEPIVAQRLFRNSISLLVGEGNTGKSFVTTDLAMRLAHQGHRVVYLAAEGGYDYQNRVASWCAHNKQDLPPFGMCTFLVINAGVELTHERR